MNKPSPRARGALAVALLCVFAGLFWWNGEPRDRNGTVGEHLDWMARTGSVETSDRQAQAVFMMGPDVIPYLRRALRRRNHHSLLVFLHDSLPAKMGEHLPFQPDASSPKRLAWAAAECLAAFGPLARPAEAELLDCLSDDDVGTVYEAFRAIWSIGPGPEDLPLLVSALKWRYLGTREYAARLIARIGATNEPMLDCLTQLARDPAAGQVRWAAIRDLGDLGPRGSPALPDLIRNLDDPDACVRILSAEAVWRLRGRTNAPVEVLMKEIERELREESLLLATQSRYQSGSYGVKLLARALEQIGGEAQLALPLLHTVREALGAARLPLRVAAAKALWSVGGETNGLEELCREGVGEGFLLFTPWVQTTAADLLCDVCMARQSVSLELRGMRTNRWGGVRCRAARALWRITREPAAVIPELVDGLQYRGRQDHAPDHDNSEVGVFAAETLGEMGPKARSAVPGLVAALKDVRPSVRVAAANALREIDPAAAASAGVK